MAKMNTDGVARTRPRQERLFVFMTGGDWELGLQALKQSGRPPIKVNGKSEGHKGRTVIGSMEPIIQSWGDFITAKATGIEQDCGFEGDSPDLPQHVSSCVKVALLSWQEHDACIYQSGFKAIDKSASWLF